MYRHQVQLEDFLKCPTCGQLGGIFHDPQWTPGSGQLYVAAHFQCPAGHDYVVALGRSGAAGVQVSTEQFNQDAVRN